MNDFAHRLLAWYDSHGRHDLPWQQEPTPYRVWVSEIMLQQTQVTTVIPYYQRFMQRFPQLEDLASAQLDEVLAHWSGLGYYSRARNLHRAAQIIRDEHGGEFPQQIETLIALPGIGRSTAGAILSLACGQRQPILDGNVKRVLSRFHAVEGWPGQRQVEQQLWQLAEKYTPEKRVGDYTQAIMDLGATLCTRSRPDCGACPMEKDCLAHKQKNPTAYPGKKPRKELPLKHTHMLVLENEAGEFLLQRRPPAGIWGGLWSLPECSQEADIDDWCTTQLGLEIRQRETWPEVLHTFSHFRLNITPWRCRVSPRKDRVMEPEGSVWYKSRSFHQLGLPTPVRNLLDRLVESDQE